VFREASRFTHPAELVEVVTGADNTPGATDGGRSRLGDTLSTHVPLPTITARIRRFHPR
jgi:hypothetical protein